MQVCPVNDLRKDEWSDSLQDLEYVTTACTPVVFYDYVLAKKLQITLLYVYVVGNVLTVRCNTRFILRRKSIRSHILLTA